MTAGWKAKATLESGERLAAFNRRTQERGRELADLQRRMAAHAVAMRTLQAAMGRLLEIAGAMTCR